MNQPDEAARARRAGARCGAGFADLEQWHAWSMGTAMRGLWMATPAESHPQILNRVERLLADAGGSLDVAIRYTFGRA